MSSTNRIVQDCAGMGDVAAAIDAGRQLAQSPISHPDGARYFPFVILDDVDGAQQIHPLNDDFRRNRPAEEYAGTRHMEDLESFLNHWLQFSDGAASAIYAQMRPSVQFTAVYNEHTKSTPNWRDFRCVYKPRTSPEWDTWTKQDRKDFDGNTVFALWIESQLPDIASPGPEDFLAMARTFRVNENIHFANAVRLSNGHTDLAFKRIVDGQASDSSGGTVSIPEEFRINIPVFDGLDAQRFDIMARFRYRVQNSGIVKIWYELIRPAKVMEEAFREMTDQIKLHASRMYFGSPV